MVKQVNSKSEWLKYKIRILKAIEQVNEMHGTFGLLINYTKHLEKLDKLEDIAATNKNIESNIAEVKDKLIGPATGSNRIPTETANMLVKILGFVIIGLVVIIVFILTGQHFGLIGVAPK